ncbi:vWA domain-containing protein [Actinokineospora sp. NPDC004072]
MRSDVLPCYVVFDVSSSMSDHMDELNAGLREFRGAVHADPAAAARVRVCVVGFAERARVLQPLRPVAELAELAGTELLAGSRFGPAFAFLRRTVERDVRGLKEQRLAVSRPVVFFTSDGRATDPLAWPSALAALADPGWPARPAVAAFGIGAADPDALGRIGAFRVFLRRDGVRMGAALAVAVAAAGSRADRV